LEVILVLPALVPEIPSLFLLDKRTLRRHIRSNTSTSLLIPFINQLMFNLLEMVTTTEATQNLLVANGV